MICHRVPIVGSEEIDKMREIISKFSKLAQKEFKTRSEWIENDPQQIVPEMKI